MTTREVFGDIQHLDDTPWENYRGTIWRAPLTYTDDIVYSADTVDFVTDAAGHFSVDLAVDPGYIATYYVIQWRGEAMTFSIMPGDPVNITQLLGVSPGGADIIDESLAGWVAGNSYELTAITYNVTYPNVIATATVKWPDGSAGTFTTTTTNTTWQAIDAYTITHTLSGKTVTQPLITRNVNGDVTIKPALTVA
jgi:hypothetical protein